MKRVLIVDDHGAFRSRIRALLEAEGLEIVGEAADARAGLAEALLRRPEVALVDIGLPDLDGFGLAAALRDRVPDAAVVLTSSRDSVDASRVAASGARGFLPKDELSAAGIQALVGD
jgi:DNA-binding NarL/FixJ family response regulator